jgi:hypothetical protein
MVCFVFTLSAFAQDGDKAIPLKSILLSIEKQHHVVFNYIDNEVDTFKIISPKPSLTLEEKIDYLKIKTQLSFENINNQFINIFNKIESPSTIICGYVLSKGNNLPLENVNVQLVNGNNTITNEKGYFELKNINSKEINFSYVGFTSVKISLSEIEKKGCITVSLNQEISELSNINTTHFLTSGISKELNGSFIIKPKKLGILPGLIESDVLQTMQKIPGIYSADESIASINVRGGTHDQNLFLWNGIRMYQTGHFFGLISVFNPNIAHTISIYKNGSSAFYGESVSSVVDISSNTEKLEKNSYSAGLNMINADVFAKFKINKNGFVEIAARRSINDLVKTPAYNQYFNKAFQNTTITNFELLEQLVDNFAHIGISLSIDGTDKVYEYLRHPGKWNIVLENIKQYHLFALKHKSKVNITICHTIGWLNAFYLTDFHKFVYQNFPAFKIWNNIIHFPDHMALASMPIELKTAVINKIEQFNFNARYETDVQAIVNCIKGGNAQTLDKLLPTFEIHDKHRNENIKESFQEVFQFFHSV